MVDPRIYLTIDNCFAAKRWTAPDQWARQVRALGLSHVECSADNEADPLYMGDEYMRDWIAATRKACAESGVSVANLFSGHGTYASLGLSHDHDSVRLRFRDQWIKPMAAAAAALDAGLGFFCHGFPETVLVDPLLYQRRLSRLIEDLADIAVHAATLTDKPIGIEQMYTPHQPPWTIAGALDMLRRVHAGGGNLYVTVDTGHAIGQSSRCRPTAAQIESLLTGQAPPATVWLGHPEAYLVAGQAIDGRISHAEAGERITALVEQHPYLFAEPSDGDPYEWLRNIGPWSPIVHLQQTDNTRSAHLPFTGPNNRNGIIEPRKVLDTIAEGYRDSAGQGMPRQCESLYLTIEVFAGTNANQVQLIDDLCETVRHWRKTVPRDGMHLSELTGSSAAGH